MLRRWMAHHKSLVSTVSSGIVIASLIATVAVISTGYSSKRMDLDDSSVWVANGAAQFIGRANTAVRELNSVVPATGADIDVVQQGDEVLLFDRENNTIDIVDPATATVEDSAAMPTEAPEVHLAGPNVVIHATTSGAVWILAVSELANFDAAAEPDLTLGEDSIASVSVDGILFAFSAITGTIYRVDATTPALASQSEPITGQSAGDSYQITSVGGEWVLLNESTRQIITADRTIDLDGVAATGDLAIQRPSHAETSVL